MTGHPSLATTRREILRFCLSLSPFGFPALLPESAVADDLSKKFNFFAKNGHSNCSQAVLDAIPTLPNRARPQGSCCGPMDLHRYSEQLAGLKANGGIAEIPPDPGLAKRLLAAYGLELAPPQQQAYDEAVALSSEKGPCCCQCWRWHAYGDLGKLLIRDRGFDGRKLALVWNLSDGCGGADHVH
jgi:hypothetical protein